MPTALPDRSTNTAGQWAAWGVHLFTACGAVCCLWALRAAAEQQWKAMFVWLGAAVVIDAVDGTLARAAKVRDRLPNFDGTLLDMIIDYAGYVLVPAFALARSELLPDRFAWPIASAVCIASAFQFCQADAKTEDHFFKGFPSYWNIVLFYLFLGKASPSLNAAIVLTLAGLVFVPIKYLYPSRTPQWKLLTLVLSAFWAVTIGWLLWRFPHVDLPVLYASLAYVGYYVATSLYFTWRTRQ